MTDDRPRVETTKAINLRQLTDEVGAPLSAGEGVVVAALPSGITQSQLAAAVAEHNPKPDYGLPSEVLTLRQLAAKSTLTAADVAAGVKALIKRAQP